MPIQKINARRGSRRGFAPGFSRLFFRAFLCPMVISKKQTKLALKQKKLALHLAWAAGIVDDATNSFLVGCSYQQPVDEPDRLDALKLVLMLLNIKYSLQIHPRDRPGIIRVMIHQPEKQ